MSMVASQKPEKDDQVARVGSNQRKQSIGSSQNMSMPVNYES